MKKSIISRILSLGLAAALIFTSQDLSGVTVYAAETSEDAKSEADEESIINGGAFALPIDYDTPQYEPVSTGRNRTLVQATSLPSKYPDSISDLTSTWPATRSQSPYGTCWAHATIGITEMSAIKQGYASKDDINLSESQLVQANYNSNVDPMGGLEGDTDSFDASQSIYDFGGNVWWGIREMIRWSCTASESTDTKYQYDQIATRMASDGQFYLDDSGFYQDDAYYVTGAQEIPIRDIEYSTDSEGNSVKTITNYATDDAKKAIQTYGGLAIDYYEDFSSYNSSNNCYYQDVYSSPNHAVIIVGWDDDFSASNFTRQPAGDGAWIIRNSWTTSTGASHSSYFYMSYYEKSLTTTGYAVTVTPASEYDNNYQYDGGNDCWVDSYSNGEEVVKSANVFTVQGAENYTKESLTAVQFSNSAQAGLTYTIDIYKNLTEDPDSQTYPESGTHVEAATTTGTTTYAGIYTIPLENAVELSAGDTYSVVITLTKTVGGITQYHFVDNEYGGIMGNDFSVWGATTAKAGQSYEYDGSAWWDYGEVNNKNLCIKGFTKNITTGTNYMVLFDANGGSGTTASLEAAPSASLALTTNGFTRYGYSFTGWNTKADGTGTSYSDGQTVSNLAEAGKYIKLYAQWTANGFVITFDANGGSGSMSEIAGCVTGGTYTLTANTFTKSGAEFNGWNTEADGSGDAYYDYQDITLTTDDSNVTLYAQWVTDNASLFTMEDNGTVVTAYLGHQRTVTIPDGVQILYSGDDNGVFKGVFKDNAYIEYVHLPDSLDSIYSRVFEGATALKTITIPKNVTQLGQKAFYGCTSLTNVIIEEGVTATNNGGFTFQNCTALGSVQWPSSLPTVWTYSFYGCTSLVQLTLPDGVTTICANAFDHCTSLCDLSLPETITSIGRFAFNNTDLTSIELPYSLTSLDASAFNNCSGLTSISLHKNISELTERSSTSYYLLAGTSQNIVFHIAESGSTIDTLLKATQGYQNGLAAGRFSIIYDLEEPEPYTINFDANGGSGSMSSFQGLSTKAPKTAPNCSFTYYGYNFTGWNTQADGSGTSYALGDTLPQNTFTLYAQWTAKTIVVSFNVNGGNSGLSSITATYMSTYGSLPTPTRKGYRFDGWFTSKIGGSQITSSTSVSTESDLTLYAHWTAKTYTITFDTNGGDALPAGDQTRTVTYEQTYGGDQGSLPTPSRTGYDFTGWYTTTGVGDKITASDMVLITANRTLYAHWSPRVYTISLNVNGGNPLVQETYSATYGEEFPDLQPAPTKGGYHFDGWYYNGCLISCDGIYNYDYDLNLTAHWTANTYTISFDANGGSGTMTPFTAASDEMVTLPENTFTREGYYFLGWALEATATTAFYQDQNMFSKSMAQDDVLTLYAVWSNTPLYQISLDPCTEEVSLETGSISVKEGESYSDLPDASQMVRAGYTFNGWYTSENGGEKVKNGDTLKENADHTLYAHWTANSYKINLNVNGGTALTTTSYTVSYLAAIPTLPTPTRKGYHFLGWYDTGGNKASAGATYTYTSDLSLKASWAANTYTILYVANGGKGTMKASSLSYDVTGRLTANSFKRSYYTFAGWNTKANGKGKAYANKASVKNLTATNGGKITLYAQWKAINYTIKYNLNKGKNNKKNPKTYTYVTKTFKLQKPTRKGYTFVGWYSDKKFKHKVTQIKKGSHKNLVLYAKWKKK